MDLYFTHRRNFPTSPATGASLSVSRPIPGFIPPEECKIEGFTFPRRVSNSSFLTSGTDFRNREEKDFIDYANPVESITIPERTLDSFVRNYFSTLFPEGLLPAQRRAELEPPDELGLATPSMTTGEGKTTFLCLKSLFLCLKFPDFNILIFTSSIAPSEPQRVMSVLLSLLYEPKMSKIGQVKKRLWSESDFLIFANNSSIRVLPLFGTLNSYVKREEEGEIDWETPPCPDPLRTHTPSADRNSFSNFINTMRTLCQFLCIERPDCVALFYPPNFHLRMDSPPVITEIVRP